jgi:hypothetical protein
MELAGTRKLAGSRAAPEGGPAAGDLLTRRIVHELRNALCTVELASAQLRALPDVESADAREFCGMIESAAARAADALGRLVEEAAGARDLATEPGFPPDDPEAR